MRGQRSIFQRFGLFLFTILLAMFALWYTLNKDTINFDNFHRWMRYGDLELSIYGESEAFLHAGGEMASFALAEQGFVMVSQSGSRYYTLTGDVFAERVVNFSNPVIHIGNQSIVTYDAGGQGLWVYGEQEEKFALNLGDTGDILSARLNQNDWLTVVSQESGYKGVVTVYNKDYDPIMNISLSSTYVMDAFLSPDNKKVALVTIGQEDGVFQSNLLLYTVGNEDKAAENISFSGQVVLDMDYEKDYIWLLCEKNLILVDANNFELQSWSFSGQYLKDATLTGDGFATLLLGKYRAGTADRLVTIGKNAQVLGEVSLSSSPLAVSSAGNYTAYLTSESLTLYTSNLEEYASLEEIRHANELAVTADGTVLLASNQEAWLYVPVT